MMSHELTKPGRMAAATVAATVATINNNLLIRAS